MMKKTSLLFSFISGFFITFFLLLFGIILYAVIGYELGWSSLDLNILGLNLVCADISQGEGFSFGGGIGLPILSLIVALLNVILTKCIRDKAHRKN